MDRMNHPAWHHLDVRAITDALQTDAGPGLSDLEAARRLAETGPNQLQEAPRQPWWSMLLGQFQDSMVMMLLAATVISWALGERADAITIVAIVVLNALLGFVQEHRAEQSLAALRQLTAPVARVRRNGAIAEVTAIHLVPGDMVLLEAGDRVPADARLLSAHSLAADESALTGESVPAGKNAAWSGRGDAPPGDRRNMVHMGTVITAGRAEGLVVATGMDTEMGRIAGLIQEVEEGPTPLQRRLDGLGRSLGLACLGVCALVVMAGALRGEALHRMFLTGVSLAVAAIPEGLPATVTVCLALGMQRMIRRKAVVRKLQAVETLGCATVILSDKTGTLTKNEMMVRVAWAAGQRVEVTGQGYHPSGDYLVGGKPLRAADAPALLATLRAAALCNNAALVDPAGKARAKPGFGTVRGAVPARRGHVDPRQWAVHGDPTEGALLVAAAKAGLGTDRLSPDWERLAEAPFSSERRMMSVLVRPRAGGATQLCVKGAPDAVLRLCTHLLGSDGLAHPLTDSDRAAVQREVEALAGRAMRVLAVASRPWGDGPLPADLSAAESNLTFAGLLGMIDPPRTEARRAVAAARSAGIRTVMITGDHPATALAVARELNIVGPDGHAVTGRDLDALSEDELVNLAETARVFARVSPHHKLRIVRAFRSRGEVAAMTGDGVNDAPAVKEADIGIAMGRAGSDVTKEASQLVLADDNFATIVAAVEEGRGIYDNIRKFIRYLLGCNTGEVLVMIFAALLRLPLPLLPLQILWVNLATDGLPALALSVDPPEPGLMQRPPRPSGESVFARGLGRKILGRGVFIGAAALMLFIWGLTGGLADLDALHGVIHADSLTYARTLAFAGLVMAQLIYVFDCRAERRTIWETGLFTNLYLVGAVGVSLVLLMAAIYWPPLSQLMETVPLNAMDWLTVLSVAGAAEVMVVGRRLFIRHAVRGWQGG